VRDNDLSADPTRRYWVMAEVVFLSDETTETKKTGWFSRHRTDRVTYTPDLRILSMLWQWSVRLGVRMELIFFGDIAIDANRLWQMLDRSNGANPFSEYFAFGSIDQVISMLPYRPDLMGVIDIPSRSAMYGGLGLTTENFH
jgi:hypothetical protein